MMDPLEEMRKLEKEEADALEQIKLSVQEDLRTLEAEVTAERAIAHEELRKLEERLATERALIAQREAQEKAVLGSQLKERYQTLSKELLVSVLSCAGNMGSAEIITEKSTRQSYRRYFTLREPCYNRLNRGIPQ
jgi:hypothetical protein